MSTKQLMEKITCKTYKKYIKTDKFIAMPAHSIFQLYDPTNGLQSIGQLQRPAMDKDHKIF